MVFLVRDYVVGRDFTIRFSVVSKSVRLSSFEFLLNKFIIVVI